MEIEFYGGNCFKVKTKQTTIVIDDNLKQLGAKSIQNDKTVALYTSQHVQGTETGSKSRLVISSPGEFEIGDVTVTGLQVRGHMDEEGTESATVFQLMYDNRTVTFTGHVHPDVSAEFLELAGGTEVLVVPVGGGGYTLDAVGAAGIVKKVEPNVVVPAHYEQKGLNFEVPAAALEEFTKVMPAGEDGPQSSYKLAKGAHEAAGQVSVVVLQSQG